MQKPDPVHPADAAARAQAQGLLKDARHAALAVTDPATRTPGISRIALGLASGIPHTLISSLSAHHAALTADPACAIMLGDPGPKGDPLTHPRLMIRARAGFVPADDPARPGIRARWLVRNPKALVYIDLSDFAFVRLTPTSALLNGGFARAFRLTPEDL